MPLRKMSTPRQQKELQKKLVAAYQEQNFEQILNSVKDHVSVISNRAGARRMGLTNKRRIV